GMASHAALRARAGAVLAAIALVILVGCGGDDDEPTVASDTPATTVGSSPSTTTSTGTVLSVTVRGGSVVEGGSRQRATLNQPVTIRVTSDVADEVHVHGYEKKFPVAAGQRGEVTFVANIPGVFEVEFERSHKQLFTMEVR
ncbi:MAG TPA: hypothetical protein VFK43_04755, partial [Acidimicrobiales bacterium]|nr:hypothetical protein [Acidimicrobiales bacterium]